MGKNEKRNPGEGQTHQKSVIAVMFYLDKKSTRYTVKSYVARKGEKMQYQEQPPS